jgi:hypothetical protein
MQSGRGKVVGTDVYFLINAEYSFSIPFIPGESKAECIRSARVAIYVTHKLF